MKKFARFLILAFMLSALLCVTAFAEGTFSDVADGTEFAMYGSGDRFDVTYTGVTAGKQYAIMMIAEDSDGYYTINDESILYINQAAASGPSITFTVYPKEMANAQILLTGEDQPIILGYYVAASSEVSVEIVGVNNTAQYTINADGTTLNVQNSTACVVTYSTDDGQSYQKLSAANNSAGGYDYDLSGLAQGTVVYIAVKGDTNADGSLTAADAAAVTAIRIGKVSGTALMKVIADINGDGNLTAADAAGITAVRTGKTSVGW